jgi:transcriptional regulator with XRE-family HTH domain
MALMDGAEPGEARTPADYVALLRRLKEHSGLTYRQLEERAAERGDVLARSTLADVLRRDALPRPEVVAALVRACGAEKHLAEWLAARERLAGRERLASAGRPGASGTLEADREPGRLPAGRPAPETDRPANGGAGDRRSRTVPLIVAASLGTVLLLALVVILLPRDDDAAHRPDGGATAAGPAPGWSRIRPLRAPTLCLTEGEARVKGETKAVAVQRPCAEATPPRTYLQRESDGLYVIKWEHPEHGPGCLTVLDEGPFRGMLEPWNWNLCQGDSGAQRFSVERAPDGDRDHWRLRSVQDASRPCVGIRAGAGDAGEAGAVAVVQRCAARDADQQVFVIGPE